VGATNATEIANGWYYVDLSTTDTGTAGPLIIRGTSSGVDDVEIWVLVGTQAVNVTQINGSSVTGTGTSGDKWRH
jgi:hypothetical protein